MLTSFSTQKKVTKGSLVNEAGPGGHPGAWTRIIIRAPKCNELVLEKLNTERFLAMDLFIIQQKFPNEVVPLICAFLLIHLGANITYETFQRIKLDLFKHIKVR